MTYPGSDAKGSADVAAAWYAADSVALPGAAAVALEAARANHGEAARDRVAPLSLKIILARSASGWPRVQAQCQHARMPASLVRHFPNLHSAYRPRHLPIPPLHQPDLL